MKLRKVLMVNRILARSVWEISPELISEIVENPQVTHNELSLFVQILAFAHQQSTIALAMGLVT